MSQVVLTGVVKRYGRVTALDGVDLTVPAGELTAVLGPSGCGKTTLLRCLAGFERLDAGEITLDGRPVAGGGRHLPAHRRRIAVVPQEGALFPHLSVAANIGYGLDRAARRGARVEEVLTLVGLAGYGDRMPHQLSGGQQQRVAVARALAPRPSLVLLDEPFSALDAGLRAGLRQDIREALRADGATGVLVTHDQGEALSVADRVVVLRSGQVVQADTPTAVYRSPADPWVAGFVGDAVLLDAVVESGQARTALGPIPVAGTAASGRVTVLVRPEQVRIVPSARPDTVSATVLRHDFHGHDALVGLRLTDGTRITARILDDATAAPVGTDVMVRVDGTARAWPA
ncbi:ABC transporter ATP-binding protein [Micromonospora sp. NPDC000207]|uniref:ABC transporter ATP-binding protein n=1 Tax=Micromonospora sp. NPDC000207 TaxID=3154246 RepID=UPI0033214417